MKIWPGQTEDLKPPPMSPKEKGNLWLGFSSLFFVAATYSYFFPPSGPSTGRWTLIHNAFFSLFGSSGDVVLFTLIGCASLLAAFSHYGSNTHEEEKS